MKSFTVGALAVLVASCASNTALSPDEAYERQDQDILNVEEFWNYKKACRKIGGSIMINRGSKSLPRKCMYQSCPPRRFDRYSCVSL